MPDPITDKLIRERQDLVTRAEGLKQTAFDQKQRDLTDTERSTLEEFSARIGRIDEQLKLTTRNYQLDEETSAAIARYSPAALVPDTFNYRSEGEALWDVLHMRDDDAARARLARVTAHERAAQHMGSTAAATTATAGGFDGIIVNPVLGPVVQMHPTTTPFLTLLGPRDFPAGKFLRPRLVDPDLLTAAGPHAGGLEKGELPSKKWDYAEDPVQITLIGNYINLSYEAISWVPSSLQMVIDHLRLRTALGLEAAAVAEADKTGNTITLAADADAAAAQAAVWDAMAQVFIATGQPATWMAAGPLGVSMLGGKTDLAGRPLFPFVGPSNALGTASNFAIVAPFGLQLAETPAITDTTLYVGNSAGLEAYVRYLPVLQADEPSVYGKQIGSAAAVGWFHPTTSEAGPGNTPPAEYNAIVKIAP